MDGLYVLNSICKVCGGRFVPRTPLQRVCSLLCVYRDPDHNLGVQAAKASEKRLNHVSRYLFKTHRRIRKTA